MKRIFPFLIFFWALSAAAVPHPVNFSLVPEVALHGRGERIEGFTLSVWGENPQSSFAIGFVNGMTGASSGLALGFLINYAQSYTGCQLAFINYNKGSMTGFQWGAVNYAKAMKGLQLGFINYAETMDSGIQIGLVNVISENRKWFGEFPKTLAPFMIFANWRFR